VAPSLVTAAVPRDLRVTPVRKSRKEASLGAWREEAMVVVDAGVHGQGSSIATFYSGNAHAKFAKTFNIC
jgi:hypothetical protein